MSANSSHETTNQSPDTGLRLSTDSNKKKQKSKAVGSYLLSQTIGEGTFGKVKIGTKHTTGQKVAVKILEKEKIREVADVERVAREIFILKLVKHKHIILLHEIIETPKQLYLFMEFAPKGELFDHIVNSSRAFLPYSQVNKTRLTEKEACRFLQ